MDIEEMKRYLKESLVVEVEYESKYSEGNNMIVSLRFFDDEVSFTDATIFIPDD
jgi:hypothetical protein